MEVRFFDSAAELRRWLNRHHDAETELWIGFHRKGSSRGGITYPEALDEALCFGWIDGVRRSLDDASYAMRFSPRKRGSYWSVVNTRRAEELIAEGRMRPPGQAAFERRDRERTRRYAYERAAAALDPAEVETFRSNPPAWAFFQAQPAGYRRTVTWWVVSAKRKETRRRRLASLIEASARGEPVGVVTRPDRGARPR